MICGLGFGPRDQTIRATDRGSIMLLALVASLAILMLGLAALWLSYSSTAKYGQAEIRRQKEARAAAEAGIQHARQVLASVPDWSHLLSGGRCGLRHGAQFPGHVVLCDQRGLTNVVPLQNILLAQSVRATRTRTGSYTVFVRNDEDEAAVQGQRDDDRRIVVRSEGRGSRGLGKVALEVVLTQGWLRPAQPHRYGSEGQGPGGSGAYGR